jgi:hypothetical protein
MILSKERFIKALLGCFKKSVFRLFLRKLGISATSSGVEVALAK